MSEKDSASRLSFEQAVSEVLAEDVSSIVLVAVVENSIYTFVSDVDNLEDSSTLVEALQDVVDDIEYGATSYPDLQLKRH